MKEKNKFKIALISPQVVAAKNQIRKAQPPLGILSLAAVLEEKGFDEILLIDAVVEDFMHVDKLNDSSFIKFGALNDVIIDKINKFNPDIVGISCIFSAQAEGALSLSKDLKKYDSGLPILLGGGHVSFLFKEIMKENDCVDFILAGEADYTFAEFIDKYISGGDYNNIPGLVYRNGSKVIKNQNAKFINDLNKLPFPAFHLIDMEKYFDIGMPHNPFVKSGRVGSIITSRGCPQRCYFCSAANYFGHTFRPLSSERVIEMIGFLVKKYSVKEIQILDDTFTTDYKRVIDICKGIKDFKLRITLPNGIRADIPKNHTKRFEMFKIMREAGVEQFGISVEHGDQVFLNEIINKKLDLREVIKTCDLAHDAGILVHANFMMGFPFENESNRQKTIDFARDLDADSFSVSLAAPLPGTRLWDIVNENNLFMESYDVNRMVYVNVNIVPDDISIDNLYKTVERLNRKLNETAQAKRPGTRKKYELFKGKKSHGDRKYHFIEQI